MIVSRSSSRSEYSTFSRPRESRLPETVHDSFPMRPIPMAIRITTEVHGERSLDASNSKSEIYDNSGDSEHSAAGP